MENIHECTYFGCLLCFEQLAGFVTSNVGALASGAGFAAGASAISEISPHVRHAALVVFVV